MGFTEILKFEGQQSINPRIICRWGSLSNLSAEASCDYPKHWKTHLRDTGGFNASGTYMFHFLVFAFFRPPLNLPWRQTRASKRRRRRSFSRPSHPQQSRSYLTTSWERRSQLTFTTSKKIKCGDWKHFIHVYVHMPVMYHIYLYTYIICTYIRCINMYIHIMHNTTSYNIN